MTKEELAKVRGWLVENIFRNSDIMLSDNRYFEIYGDPRELEELDMCEVIASLYELLHREVEGEDYGYFFHHANKVGSWVEDKIFINLLNGGKEDGN